MHSTQNERINQITISTLIVGVDIAKFKHVAQTRLPRSRVREPITFKNNRRRFSNYSLVGSKRLQRSKGSRTSSSAWSRLAITG